MATVDEDETLSRAFDDIEWKHRRVRMKPLSAKYEQSMLDVHIERVFDDRHSQEFNAWWNDAMMREGGTDGQS